MVVWEQLKHLINKKKKNSPLWILISSSVHLILTWIFKEKKKTCWFYSVQQLLAERIWWKILRPTAAHFSICHSAFTFPPSYSNNTYWCSEYMKRSNFTQSIDIHIFFTPTPALTHHIENISLQCMYLNKDN